MKILTFFYIFAYDSIFFFVPERTEKYERTVTILDTFFLPQRRFFLVTSTNTS
jgi:hypothetical protein